MIETAIKEIFAVLDKFDLAMPEAIVEEYVSKKLYETAKEVKYLNAEKSIWTV